MYISLLRGINVSGQKMIKMPDLKRLYENLGFLNVQTYIQSGNVMFEDSQNRETSILAGMIEKEIEREMGFSVCVLVFTKKRTEDIFSENPFDKSHEQEKIYFTLLKSVPAKELVEKLLLSDFGDEKFCIFQDVIYFYCPESYGKTKLNNNFFEKKLKTNATTRNFRTMQILAEWI
jgi:uncharacterized protein (DUF1697 family)